MSITDQAQVVGERIASTSCVLEIHIRQPGFRKKINSASFLAKSGNNANIHSDVLTVAKDVLEKRDIAYLEAHRTNFLKKLKGYSVYGGGLALGNGQYLMPLASVEEIKKHIVEYQLEREALLNQFEADYERLKAKAKEKLGGFYSDYDYPPFQSIRQKYTVDYKFISNSVPEELKKINDKIYREESVNRKLAMQKLTIELQEIMRANFLGLITHFSERLGRDSQTGKFSSLSEARFNELTEFINTFANKNIIGDKDLEAIVKSARASLQGLGIRNINSNEELRDEVAKTFEGIKASSEALVNTHTRAIDVSKL